MSTLMRFNFSSFCEISRVLCFSGCVAKFQLVSQFCDATNDDIFTLPKTVWVDAKHNVKATLLIGFTNKGDSHGTKEQK